MSLSHFLKSISLVTGSLVVTTALFADSAAAFSVTFTNGGFENNYTNWSQTGDTSIQNTFQGITPVQGSNHALITTGHNTRLDDSDTNASTFNYSGTDPVTATTDSNADELQGFLGLSTNSLSILRQNSADDTAFRTPKEGSGIYQDFTVTIDSADVASGKNKIKLSFNWAYLTNDATDSIFGDQDFGFVTFYDITSDLNTRSIDVLDDSAGNISYPFNSGLNTFQGTNTTNYTAGNQYSYASAFLPAGTYFYRVGFGVVDVDGIDRTSGLLLDNFMIEEVPFEFSPAIGLWIVGGSFGLSRLYRKLKNATNLTKISK
jgi:hypothetical protein